MKKILILISVMLLILAGCEDEKEKKIIIAEQYGLAYAPVTVMRETGILEKKLPDYEIEWVKLENTAAIREAMIAGSLDVGFVGIPPFLIGLDSGADWKIMSGVSISPLALITNDDSITGIEDIGKNERIALPQPGSIQHILLSMLAKRKLGDHLAFDSQLVTMNHPDGMQALISGAEVSLHFTSPPYMFEEMERGMKVVAGGEECFGGEFTFIVGVASKQFHENKEAYEAVSEALKEAMLFIDENKEESTRILSETFGYDKEKMQKYLYESGMKYESKVYGLEEFASFMLESGYIKNSYKEDDLIW